MMRDSVTQRTIKIVNAALPVVGRCPRCRCTVFYSSDAPDAYCTGCRKAKELFGDA
jgi:hypothetical protein